MGALGKERMREREESPDRGDRKKEDKMPPLYTLSVGKAEGEGNKILL